MNRVGSVRGRFAAAGAVLPFLMAAAHAGTYEQHHDFELTPGGNVLPNVTAYYVEHAWDVQNGQFLHSSVVPAVQPPGFDRFGLDWMHRGRNGYRVVNGSFPGTPVGLAATAVPAGGWAFFSTASVGPDSTAAFARSTFSVNPYRPGTKITGRIGVDGDVELGPPERARGFAASYSGIVAQGGVGLGHGRIQWLPAVHDAVFGRRYDPIDFQIFDSLGDSLLQDDFFWQEAYVDVAGTYSWENDALTIHAPGSFEFHLDMPGLYTSMAGKLDLVVQNGIVVAADDGGAFDGLLPALGTSAADLTIPLQTEFDFDYDLGSLTDGDKVAIEFDDMGQALEESPVPEPASLGGLALGVAALLGLGRRRRA